MAVDEAPIAQFDIRPFRPDDRARLYAICLATADNGSDATALYADPMLPGHVFVAPYVDLEPDLCFVLVGDDDTPQGYVLGTRDSAQFEARSNVWFDALRRLYAPRAETDQSRDARMIRLIQLGHRADAALAQWPAHLHIDLLPAAQGKGNGRRLLDALLDHLRAAGVNGVHALTGPGNPRAMRFYERAGFTRVRDDGRAIAYGLRLADAA